MVGPVVGVVTVPLYISTTYPVIGPVIGPVVGPVVGVVTVPIR
jgi:hypothetical protein